MTDLTQAEADTLLALEKHRVDDTQWDYPASGSISIPLASSDQREQFYLDIRRSRINHQRDIPKSWTGHRCSCPTGFWRTTASQS